MPNAFRLATLLKLREATRDERRGALAAAFRAEAVLAECTQAVDDEFAALARDYRDATRPGRIDVDQLLVHQRREALLIVERREYARQHEVLLAEIERRREALAAADREVRTLEKLRQRQTLAATADASRASVKQLDEFAILRATGGEEAVWDA